MEGHVTGRIIWGARLGPPCSVSTATHPLHAGLRAGNPYPAVVRVYLCRHAQAVAGEPDELRGLTSEGFAQAKALGARLAEIGRAHV